jgi:hypothetical protein
MMDASIVERRSAPLPRPIRRALGRVEARLRWLDLTRGLGTVALVAAASMAVGIAADLAWPLPIEARWGIWLAWVGLVGLVVIGRLIRPALARRPWVALAALAERADPNLGERVTSAVALLDAKARATGSPALIAAQAEDAAEALQGFDPAPALHAGKAVRRLLLGLSAVAILAAPALLRPDPFATLARRFLAPWFELDRVGRFALRVEPGDRFVAVGSDLAVEAEVTSRFGSTEPPRTVWLDWVDANQVKHRARMTRRDVHAPFQATIPAITGTTGYRVTAETSSSRLYKATAIDPPAIASLSVKVEPPPYTRVAASQARDPAKVEAIEGSRVTLTLSTTTPVAAVDLDWPAPAPEGSKRVVLDSAGRLDLTTTVEAGVSGEYRLTPRRDAHGLDGRAEPRRILVRPDAPPTLAIKGPGAPAVARPDDRLEVAIAARDDFAVAAAELHYQVESQESPSSPPRNGQVDVALEGVGTPRARGVATLALRPLDLATGDVVSYRVRVSDNKPAPAGPNVTWSEPRVLKIASQAEPLLGKEDRIRREGFQARLEAIRQTAAENRRETEQLRYAADSARRDGAAWGVERDTALASREAEARRVADNLQLLARDVEDDATYAPLARPTRQAAEVEAEAGRARLADARQAPDAARRLVDLRQADSRLGALQNRLDELKRQFDALAKLDLDRQKLRDLAAREDNLAARLAAANRDPAALEKLRAEQDAVRRDLAELLAKSPELRAGVLAAQAEEAAKLAQKARELAERQRLEARKTVEARATGPLHGLAREQRDLENDARRLALEVDDPLGENGRGRVDVDAIRRAADPIEKGDLASAVRPLEEAEDSLRRLERDVEDLPGDPRALARRLARRQEVLANDASPASAEARRDNLTPEQKSNALKRFPPLAERQEAIARLAATLKPPVAPEGPAREAEQTLRQALEHLKNPNPRETENSQNNAKRALHQLADALPDPNRQREDARRKMEEAKRKEEEVARELERHLGETTPRPDKPNAEARAAAELAERLAPLARKQDEAAEALAKLEVEPRLRPQVDRAATRARQLAQSIRDAQAQAPPKSSLAAESKPSGPWRVLGPINGTNAPLPFDPAAAVDFSRPITPAGGKPTEWREAAGSGSDGKIDLGSLYGEVNERCAFAVTDLPSRTRRLTQLALGSDDTLTVWLNGRKVFDQNGMRSYSPGQDKVDVTLNAGSNRLVIRCGNGSARWEFGVMVAPEAPEGFAPELARQSRRDLAAARADALTSTYRLEQKMHGRTPADDLASELAAELKADAEQVARDQGKPLEDDPTAREQAVADRRRVATALRNLNAPDAPALQAEAVRLAQAAASAGPAELPAASKAAASAAEALARRMATDLSPGELAAALARAERSQEAEGVERQKAIAAEFLDRHPPAPPTPAEIRARAEVRRALELSVRALQPDRGDPADPTPTPREVAQAREAAAIALEAVAEGKGEVAAPPPSAPAVAKSADDPELGLGAEQAAKAAELAQRQRRIRERLQTELAGRVEPQEALRRDAAELGRDLAELRDRVREANARAQWPANNAVDLAAEQAPRAMGQGAEQLAQGKLDAARDAQRQAADLVERAARETEDMAASLRAEAPTGAQGPSAAPSGLTQAMAALRESSRQMAASPGATPSADGATGSAQAAMERAAEGLRLAARPPSTAAGTGSPGETGAPDPGAAATASSEAPAPGAAGVAEADLSALQDLVRQKTGRRWGELPGHLRTEILQLSRGQYREDYARLIQLYFREIAADPSKPRP